MTEAQAPLSSTEIKNLKAQAHHLNPVVMLGAAGLAPSVLHEIDVALTAHGLIKVRLGGENRADREALIATICTETGSQPVQAIGKVGVFYREKPEPAKREPKHHVNKQVAGERATQRRSPARPAGTKRAKSSRK
ncbi:MAG: YhbY family RNA-binding protein [Burkholderiaceae bacterium]